MQDATDRLIERLVASTGPVRRLRPPAMRATLWLLVVVALGAMTILLFSDLALFASGPRLQARSRARRHVLTGISARVAAFHLSLPLDTLGAAVAAVVRTVDCQQRLQLLPALDQFRSGRMGDWRER